MGNNLETMTQRFREAAPEAGWVKIKLFFDFKDSEDVICGQVQAFIDYPGQKPRSISIVERYKENGDIEDWDYLDDIESMWSSQTDGASKWYSGEITIFPDEKTVFEPTSHTEPETLEKEYSL